MSTKNPNHDPDPDNEVDNGADNGPNNGRAVAPAPKGGAIASLRALNAALAKVDTSSIAGRSVTPLLQFKSREDSGTWMFGQKKTVVEDDSRWAVNPHSLKWGYVCFDSDGGNKPPLGERLVSISEPKPDFGELPDKGFPWQEQWAVDMKCLDGADAGTEVTFKASTVGGNQAIVALIDAVRDRLASNKHDGKIVPIVLLKKDSYQHGKFGRCGFRF